MTLPVYHLAPAPLTGRSMPVPAAIVKDPHLDFTALGVIVRLFALHAAGIDINTALARHKPDKALRRSLAKLVKCGYLVAPAAAGTLALTGENKPTAQRGDGQRGSVLPADWWPDPTLMDWAEGNYPFLDVRLETAKFVDYWSDVPGWRGRKLSWDGTWRNWIRKAAAAPAASSRPGTTPVPSKTQLAMQNLNDLSRQTHALDHGHALPILDH